MNNRVRKLDEWLMLGTSTVWVLLALRLLWPGPLGSEQGGTHRAWVCRTHQDCGTITALAQVEHPAVSVTGSIR